MRVGRRGESRWGHDISRSRSHYFIKHETMKRVETSVIIAYTNAHTAHRRTAVRNSKARKPAERPPARESQAYMKRESALAKAHTLASWVVALLVRERAHSYAVARMTAHAAPSRRTSNRDSSKPACTSSCSSSASSRNMRMLPLPWRRICEGVPRRAPSKNVVA